MATAVVVVVALVLHPGGTCTSGQPEGPPGGEPVWAPVRVRSGFAREVGGEKGQGGEVVGRTG